MAIMCKKSSIFTLYNESSHNDFDDNTFSRNIFLVFYYLEFDVHNMPRKTAEVGPTQSNKYSRYARVIANDLVAEAVLGACVISCRRSCS